ncbi:MAG TPA: cbb3-type cytochrome c oxidase subunit II [Thermoanaerobaculia bacterium]
MRPERGAWRGVLTIAATYVAFLLFAQFGFLSQARSDLGDAARVKAVMAAMGIAGLAASLGTAWLLGRFKGPRLIRIGLGAVAAVAAGSVTVHGFPALLAAAAGIGASIGLLTVALAASLHEIVPARMAGRAAGLGTGTAYLVSNVPALFEASPALRALFPAALALAALALFREAGDESAPREGGHAFPRLLITFLVLIWLDSAAFAIVQASPELKAQTWGSEAQKLVQGLVHFAAAAGAGLLLDLGVGLLVPLAAWALFALAFPLLQHGGFVASMAAGPLYAVGISFYSTALVVTPARGASPSPRWRAGLLYGVAGWIGSALGVGMAQDLGRIPGWFLGITGAALALTWLPRLDFRKAARLFGPALALGAVGMVGMRAEPPAKETRTDLVTLGRRVYIQEGCIHCHSQYVRPGARDEAWWGPFAAVDRQDHPPLLGVRRQGPDLLEVGNRRSARWQEAHLRDPRALNPGSRMPSYARLFEGDGERGRALVAYLASLGAATGGARGELTWEEPLPVPAHASRERGARLFATWCATCHGAAAQGNGPLAGGLGGAYTNLHRSGFHALTVGRGAEEPEKLALARVIRHGIPGTNMPGHEWLGDQQVADLVAYVRTLRR